MQNKAAIIVLAIALGLVSIYQLSFTVATYKVKKAAAVYANLVARMKQRGLEVSDSLRDQAMAFQLGAMLPA